MHVVPPLSPGASEMLMATAVQELASKTPGKESIAMEGFARALRKVHSGVCLLITPLTSR